MRRPSRWLPRATGDVEPIYKVSTLIVPIICSRCGAWKRNATGQGLYVDARWLSNRRQMCPTCFDTEKLVDALDTLVNWDEADDVPF